MLAGHVHDLAVVVDLTQAAREAKDDTQLSVCIVERLVVGVQVVRRKLIEGYSVHVSVCLKVRSCVCVQRQSSIEISSAAWP